MLGDHVHTAQCPLTGALGEGPLREAGVALLPF